MYHKFTSISLATILIVLSSITGSNAQNPELDCREVSHPNGKLKSKGCFAQKENKSWAKHGTWLNYNEKGILVDSLNYKYGSEVGERKVFNDDGKLEVILNYEDKEMPRIIKQTEYAKKGSSFTITTFKQVNIETLSKHGLYLTTWKNGNTMDSIIYNDGKKRFSAKFNKHGQLSSTIDFGENPKKGSIVKIKEYNKDGSIRSERTEHAGYNGISLY